MMAGARMAIGLLLMIATGASAAFAKPLISDISIHEIRIDSGFTGTEVLLFGARNDIGDVMVVLRGPQRDFIVRKKERVAGIWVNREEETLSALPEFFATASTRPIEDMRNPALLASLNLTTRAILNAQGGITEFHQAFIRHRNRDNLYPNNGTITFMGESLFRTVIPIPENIPRGAYTAEVYLINDNQVAGMQSTPLWITKTGFDAFIFDLAHEQPYLYGLLAITLALIAGWGASAIFSRR